MSDYDVVLLCAEAAGLRVATQGGVVMFTHVDDMNEYGTSIYDPLSNDAQAMALIKQFNIALGWNNPGWGAFRQDIKRWVNAKELNRAVVECVAMMRIDKAA